MELFDNIYNGQPVSFDFTKDRNVMVNATEMAKIFDKKVEAFMRNDSTKAFIQECLKSENSRFLNVENEEDIISSRQKTGTWMHRILALKFAAWLDPAFELWVYTTIDRILFQHYRALEASFQESGRRRSRIDAIKRKLHKNDDYLELLQLELAERQASYKRSKGGKLEVTKYKEAFDEEE